MNNKNTGNKILYSRIGDAYNMADSMLFHIAENSGGQVENYNTATREWEDNEIAGLLYEGAKFVPLKPGINYSYSAWLHVLPADKVTGVFRIVVEYADERDPGDDAKIYRDYSNTFEIK